MKEKFMYLISKLSESEFTKAITGACPSAFYLKENENCCEENLLDCCEKCWEEALK